MLAKQSSDCLREFLTHPSKILIRLNRSHAGRTKENPQITVTQSDR